VIVRNRWRKGPEAGAGGPLVVSATVFVYARHRDFAVVAAHGGLLRHRWPDCDGAVGLLTGMDPLRRTTYTLSVWTSRQALAAFLGSPEHRRLVERFRPKLSDSGSLLWEVERLDLEECWQRAEAELF
jgi:hypothetical protein